MTLGPKQVDMIRFADQMGSLSLSAGAFKSGKTYGAGLAIVLHTQRDPEPRNNLVLGRRLAVMEKAVVPAMKQAASAVGADFEYASSKGECVIGKHTYTFIAFTDKTSVGRLQGIPNVHSIVVDEAALLNHDFFNMGASRLERPDSKLWATCNPAHPLNYLKKEWLDKGKFDHYQTFFMRDNPSLDAETIRRQEAMFSGVFKMRMVDAIWAAGEGVIFSNYETAPAPDPSLVVRTDIGFDYGTSTPSAYTVLQTLRDGTYYIPEAKKIFVNDNGVGLTDSELLDRLQPVIDRWEPSAVVHDPVAASFRTEMIKSPNRQYSVRRAITASVQGADPRLFGIRKTQNALARGIVKIAPGQLDWEEEAQSYIWDADKQDQPVKINDHVMDSMRFVVVDRVKETRGAVSLPEGF